jgi:hypothetical protein
VQQQQQQQGQGAVAGEDEDAVGGHQTSNLLCASFNV